MPQGFEHWTLPITIATQDAAAAGPVVVPGVDAGPAPAGTEGQPLGDPNATGAAPAGGGLPWWLPIGMIGLLVFLMWTSSSQQKKEKKKKEELLASITKQDKVQTIGGIIGTVIELHDDEIVLRVDDTSNTRIRFARSAVQNIVTPSPNRKDLVTDAKSSVEPKPETEPVNA